MGIFDKARQALSDAAAAVSRETGVLSLQTQLGNLSAELDRQLVEVGKRARELRQQGQFQDQEIDILLRGVADIEAQMMELRQKVQDVQSGQGLSSLW